MESEKSYNDWVRQEIIPSAESYAEAFFAHLATSMDEKAQHLLEELETDEGRAWTHDLTIPIINATIMWTMMVECRKAAESWQKLYESGVERNFGPQR